MEVGARVTSRKAHLCSQVVHPGTETCSVERAVSRITGCDVMVGSSTQHWHVKGMDQTCDIAVTELPTSVSVIPVIPGDR
jgi:hypothetical protein